MWTKTPTRSAALVALLLSALNAVSARQDDNPPSSVIKDDTGGFQAVTCIDLQSFSFACAGKTYIDVSRVDFVTGLDVCAPAEDEEGGGDDDEDSGESEERRRRLFQRRHFARGLYKRQACSVPDDADAMAEVDSKVRLACQAKTKCEAELPMLIADAESCQGAQGALVVSYKCSKKKPKAYVKPATKKPKKKDTKKTKPKPGDKGADTKPATKDDKLDSDKTDAPPPAPAPPPADTTPKQSPSEMMKQIIDACRVDQKPGYDAGGSDYDAVTDQLTASSCEIRCCQDFQCQTWVWVPSLDPPVFSCGGGKPCCFLKNAKVDMVQSDYKGIVAGQVKKSVNKEMQAKIALLTSSDGSITAPSISSNKCSKSTKKEGTDANGGDYDQTDGVSSGSACESKCCASDKCNSWTWIPTSNGIGKCAPGKPCCFFKTSTPSLTPSDYPGIISGVISREAASSAPPADSGPATSSPPPPSKDQPPSSPPRILGGYNDAAFRRLIEQTIGMLKLSKVSPAVIANLETKVTELASRVSSQSSSSAQAMGEFQKQVEVLVKKVVPNGRTAGANFGTQWANILSKFRIPMKNPQE